MAETRWLVPAAVVMAALLMQTLWAADKTYPAVERYIRQVQTVHMPLREAINKVMEERGGIPVSASLEMSEEEGKFTFWVEIAKPAKGGGSVWGIEMDASTGDMESMENVTREKERELREQGKKRKTGRRDIRKYIAAVRKVGLPIQEAINKIVEEYGGVPICASLEMSEEEESELLFWIEIIRPPKPGKRATVWGFTLEAETGELMAMENIMREKERELREQEEQRKRERAE